uniref:hypothetical protein n=1 Tax=Nonlabens sp. Ci31 TaxID=2608253 RepID=UPI00197F2B07|nr:hypothetical protein [Nonlabens sp. Ci31]
MDPLPDQLDKSTRIIKTDLHFNFDKEDIGLLPLSPSTGLMPHSKIIWHPFYGL